MVLFRYVINACVAITIFFFLVFIFDAIKFIRDKFYYKIKDIGLWDYIKLDVSKRTAQVLITICIIGIYALIRFELFPTTQIGSFWEKEDYHEGYYVLLFPDKNASKNYKVKADIWSHVETYEEPYGDGTRADSNRVYTLSKVYFDNGGYLYFDDEVEVGKTCSVTDQMDGKEWGVELTDERVN